MDRTNISSLSSNPNFQQLETALFQHTAFLEAHPSPGYKFFKQHIFKKLETKLYQIGLIRLVSSYAIENKKPKFWNAIKIQLQLNTIPTIFPLTSKSNTNKKKIAILQQINQLDLRGTKRKKKCKIKSRRKKKKANLGGDATDVEAGATEGTTLLNTSGLETQLSGFDGGHVATGATADDDDVVFLRSRSESSGEGSHRRRVLQYIGTRIR